MSEISIGYYVGAEVKSRTETWYARVEEVRKDGLFVRLHPWHGWSGAVGMLVSGDDVEFVAEAKFKLQQIKAIGQEYAEKCDSLEAKIDKIRALHVADESEHCGDDWCAACSMPFPCPTLLALGNGVEAVQALLEGEREEPAVEIRLLSDAEIEHAATEIAEQDRLGPNWRR